MNPTIVLAMIAMPLSAWVLTTWLRMKVVDRTDPDAGRKIDLLSGENERLTGRIGRLEERIAVLERIATDPAARTARAIEELR